VTIAEHVGLYIDDVADAPFGGVAAAVDGRLGELDDDPAWSLAPEVSRWRRWPRCRTCLGAVSPDGKYPSGAIG
jgi:hypothetical protein